MPSSSDATPTGAREGRSSSRASKERECRTNQSYFHSSHSYGSNGKQLKNMDPIDQCNINPLIQYGSMIIVCMTLDSG